jgi:fatty acid desaturase
MTSSTRPAASAPSAAIVVGGEHLLPHEEPRWHALGRYGPINLVVIAVQAMAWALLLTAADMTRLPVWARAGAVVLFCLMMQGVFTLLHEYCHRNAHRDLRLNYLVGIVTSTLFGTAPTLLRVEHWGHHRRNRTETERPEFIHDGESAAAKRVQYYAAITGGIWLACLLAPIASLAIPWSAARRLAANARFNSFVAGLGEFKRDDWRALRIEALWLLAFWSAVVVLGPWRWQAIATCYAAFAFSWSSLQWIYHLHTPIHVVEGAYDLRAPLPLRALFLNFNYNLTHHRHPAVPWQELHAQIDLRETQPLWYRYLLVFRPPVRFPEDPTVLRKRYF